MSVFEIVIISVYISSTFISLLLTFFFKTYLNSVGIMKVKSRDICVKYSIVILTMLTILSFIPVFNILLSIKMTTKLLIEECK